MNLIVVYYPIIGSFVLHCKDARKIAQIRVKGGGFDRNFMLNIRYHTYRSLNQRVFYESRFIIIFFFSPLIPREDLFPQRGKKFIL